MPRYRDPMELDHLALNHERNPDALALSASDARPIVYSTTTSTGLVSSEPPAPQTEPEAEPPAFEPAREFGEIRLITGVRPGTEATRPPEQAWRTSWDDGATPWWVAQHQAEEVERSRAEVRERHLPNPYAKPFNPPSADPDAGAVYAREWEPALDAFLARDPRQDRRPAADRLDSRKKNHMTEKTVALFDVATSRGELQHHGYGYACARAGCPAMPEWVLIEAVVVQRRESPRIACYCDEHVSTDRVIGLEGVQNVARPPVGGPGLAVYAACAKAWPRPVRLTT